MSSRIRTDHANKLQGLSQRAILRSRLARHLSFFAGVAGVLVFLFFLFESGFFGLFESQVQLVDQIVQPSGKLSVTGTVIRGLDRQGQAFILTAPAAQQDQNDKDVVLLSEPRGVFDRSNGQLNLSSTSATYNTKSKVLLLVGKVVFEQQGRYKALLDKAYMNVDTMDLNSLSPVHVELSTGRVDADHLEISEGGKKTLFTGHVKAILKTDIESEIVP